MNMVFKIFFTVVAIAFCVIAEIWCGMQREEYGKNNHVSEDMDLFQWVAGVLTVCTLVVIWTLPIN